MTTIVPPSYILIHEACDFLLGSNCELVSIDYLLCDKEKELLNFLKQKEDLQFERTSNQSPISEQEMEMEKSIDKLNEFHSSLKQKREQHKEIKGFFYSSHIQQFGAMGGLKTLLLESDGTLTDIDAHNLYLSEQEFMSACINSEGYLISHQIGPAKPEIVTGHVIIKKIQLEKYSQEILKDLKEMRSHFNMTPEDWKKVKFATVTPDRKLVDYEDLPNFSEENKQIIMMARDEYSKFHESKKGHGEVSDLAGIIKDEMKNKGTPIKKEEGSVAAFLKINRQYWQ